MGIATAVQARLVDGIKRNAVALSKQSPSGEAWLLSGYLWSEECAEALALARTVAASGPGWLGRLLERQLADEARHAGLLRARLAAMGRPAEKPPERAVALMRAKLRRLDRLVGAYAPRFAAGQVVPLLACAARLEATGVRVFSRHVAVLEAGATADMLREILADERRHVRGCESAMARLVLVGERAVLDELEAKIARIDRALGVSSSLAVWAVMASHAVRGRLRGVA